MDDLLFDTSAGRIRYLEIAVDKDLVKEGGRDYALLPVGTARFDSDRDDVIVDLSAAELAGIPAYDRQRFSRDYETSLRGYLRDRPRGGAAARTTAAGTAAAASDRETDFYASPEYDDRSFFGARGGRASGAADRATTSGPIDRLTDAADNLKDRVDANPASRPGPDPTDRRI